MSGPPPSIPRPPGAPPLPPGVMLRPPGAPPLPPGVPRPPGVSTGPPPVPPGAKGPIPMMQQGVSSYPPPPPTGQGQGQGYYPPGPPHSAYYGGGGYPPSDPHQHSYQPPPPGNYHGGHGGYSGRGGQDSYGGGEHHRGHRGGGRDPLPRREPTNTVWVGNLDIYFQNERTIRSHMKQFGKIMRVAPHFQKNFCFVHYRTVQEAVQAVETLSGSRALGEANFNYGKMFEYSPEEMSMPYDPNSEEADRIPPPREDYPRRRDHHHEREHRRPRQEAEPSNILWIGGVPPYFSEERLREIFEVFGTITSLTRVERNGLAFIHYESEEQCTQAIEMMKDKPVDNGVVLALNYGVNRSAGSRLELDSRGYPVHETPTNVIYLGQLPSDTEADDIDKLFSPFDGYINCKHVPTNNIAFGHFDSPESARVARVSLHDTVLKGTPIRVSFGKQNHNLTMADREPPAPSGEELNLDAMMRSTPEEEGAGVLTVGSASTGGLVLPAMGGASSAPEPAVNSIYKRERPTPQVDMEVELRTLLGLPYNQCGEKGSELAPTHIIPLCTLIDQCVDAESEKTLSDMLKLHSPMYAVHAFNIVAKRLAEFFDDDPHKKLLVLYAVTRALLSAVTEYVFYNEAALHSFLMVMLVVSHGQSSNGADRLNTIIENLLPHSFLDKKVKAVDEYRETFKDQLQLIQTRVKAELDLAALLTRRKRR